VQKSTISGPNLKYLDNLHCFIDGIANSLLILTVKPWGQGSYLQGQDYGKIIWPKGPRSRLNIPSQSYVQADKSCHSYSHCK